MAFPTSPTDGQIYTWGQRTYIYSTSLAAWRVYKNSDIDILNLDFKDNVARTTANSAYLNANAAYTQANSASSYSATASGSITAGAPVIVNSDGTVSEIAATLESMTQISPSLGSATSVIVSAYDPTTGKILICIGNVNPTWYIGTITNGSLTLDYGFSLTATNTSYNGRLLYVSQNKFLFYYTDASGFLKANVMTISGTTVSAGTAMALTAVAVTTPVHAISAAYDSYNQRVVVTYLKSSVPYYQSGALSGTTVTWGSENMIIGSSTIASGRVVFNASNKTTIYIYTQGTTTQYGLSTVIPVAPTNYSWLSPTNPPTATTWFYTESGGTYGISELFEVSYNATAGKIVILCYSKNSVGAWIVHGDGKNWSNPKHIISSVSGNANSPYLALGYCEKTTATTVMFTDTGYNGFYRCTVIFDIIRNTVTFSSPSYISLVPYRMSLVSANNGQTLMLYGSTTVYGYMWQLPTTTLTSNNYIGMSSASYTNGQTAIVQLAGSVNSSQSGLTAGQAYYIQNNGTLSNTPANPPVFAGTAVSSTKITVKI